MRHFLLATGSLWKREVVRFSRDRARIIGAFAPPLVFWFLIGSGLGGSFRAPGMPEGVTYIQYFFPGTVLLIVLFTAIFSTISVIEDRREGFLQGVLVAPVSRSSLVLGKILGGSTLAFIQGFLFCLVAPAVGLKWNPGDLLFVLGELWLVSVGLTGLGFWLAWKLDSTQGFHGVMNLLLIPMWLLSGALFPISGAPYWLQIVMAVNPVTYAVAALQYGLQIQGAAAPSTLLCLGVSAVFAAATFALSSLEVNKNAS